MKPKKATAIVACTASTRAFRLGGRLPPQTSDHGAEQRQDQHPEQHRALVVAPGAGDLVDQRLRRVRVQRDQPHREVGDDEGPASAPGRRRASARTAPPPPAPRPASSRPSRGCAPTIGTTICTIATRKARISATCPSSTIMAPPGLPGRTMGRKRGRSNLQAVSRRASANVARPRGFGPSAAPRRAGQRHGRGGRPRRAARGGAGGVRLGARRRLRHQAPCRSVGRARVGVKANGSAAAAGLDPVDSRRGRGSGAAARRAAGAGCGGAVSTAAL